MCPYICSDMGEKKFLPSIQGSDGKCGNSEFDPWVRKIPWRKEWTLHSTPLPTPLFLPGESHAEEPGGLQSTVLQRVKHD